MKDFVDFINDEASDADIGKAAFECIQAGEVETLVKFFSEKGYSNSESDAKKLIANKDQYKGEKQSAALRSGY